MPALTDQQRSQIRMYLGWSERFHQTDPALEQAFNGFDSLPALQQAQTLAELSNCVDLDAQIVLQRKRLKVEQVGKIRLAGLNELAALRSEGRQSSGRMAALLGVEVRHDAWSGVGPRTAMTWDGPATGGNEVKQG